MQIASLAPSARQAAPVTVASTAMFIVDETLRLVGADAAGHALLECEGPLRTALGHICTGSHNRNMRLRECITAGISLDGLDLDGGVMVSVTPVRGIDAQATRQAVVVARITEKEEDLVELVSQGCGLTRAEGEVLRMIYKGFSTVEAARISGVAKSTVRSHLQRVFAKTETSRQSELVHFVATWQG